MRRKFTIQVFILECLILLPYAGAVMELTGNGGDDVLPVWTDNSSSEISRGIVGKTTKVEGVNDTQEASPQLSSSQQELDPQHKKEISTWFQDFNFSEEELNQAVDLTQKIIDNSKFLFLGIAEMPIGFDKAEKYIKPFIKGFSDSQRLMRTLQDLAEMSNPYLSILYIDFLRKENTPEEDINSGLDLAHELSQKFSPDIAYSPSVLYFAVDPNVINTVKEKGAPEVAGLIKKVDEALGGTGMGTDQFDPRWLFLTYSLPELFAGGKDSFEEILPYVEVFNEKILSYLRDFLPYVNERITQELDQISQEEKREEVNQSLSAFYRGVIKPLLRGGVSAQELEKIITSSQLMKDIQDLSLIYRYASDDMTFGNINFILALRSQGFDVERVLQEYEALREKVLTAPKIGKREQGDWFQKLLPQFVSNYADFIAQELKHGKDLSQVYSEVDTLLNFGTMWPNRFSWKLWNEVLIPNWEQWQSMKKDENGVIQKYPSQPVAFFPYSGYDHTNAFIIDSKDEDEIWKFHHHGIFVVYPPEIFTFSDLLEFFNQGINLQKGLYPNYIIFSGHGLPDRVIGYMEAPGAPFFSDGNKIITKPAKEYISIDLVSSLREYFDRLVAEGGYVIFNACSVGDESSGSDSLATVLAGAFGKGVTVFAPVDIINNYEVKFNEGGGISVRYYGYPEVWDGGIVPTRIIGPANR